MVLWPSPGSYHEGIQVRAA